MGKRKSKSCKRKISNKSSSSGGGKTQKAVSFHIKKNHVEKFYCPTLAKQEIEDKIEKNTKINSDGTEELPSVLWNDLLLKV